MAEQHLPIFVYGTLQRGEERCKCWPCLPLRVELATILGRIHDLGPYPALVEGGDNVLGELWYLRREDLAETLRVLDEIECFGNGGVDLYVRRIVDCRTLQGELLRAYTYYLADQHSVRGLPLVTPREGGYCRWNRRGGADGGAEGRAGRVES